MANSKVVENEPYADLEDVEEVFEGSTIDGSNEARIQRRLLQASESIDRRTNRAWREREVEDFESRIEFSGRQKRGVKSYGGQRWPLRQQDRRAFVRLPHPWIREFSSIELLYPGESKDVTDNIGVDDDLQVDYERGVIRPAVSLFKHASRLYRGINPDVRIRVSYTYGREYPDEVPYDVKRACALHVASDIVSTDQYSTVVSGGDDGIELSQSARDWREEAQKIVNDHRHYRVL